MLQSELGATERKKDSLKSGSKHIQSIFSTGRKLVLLSVVHCTRGTRLILKVQRAMFWGVFLEGGGGVYPCACNYPQFIAFNHGR